MTHSTPCIPATFSVRPGLLMLSVTMLFMAFAACMYWPQPEQAFISDNSPVAWLSSAQIWASGLLALRLSAERAISRILGVWLMLAMAGMALDEQFLLHEWWKFGCENWWSACKWQLVRELPMLAVGGFGVATAFWIQREIQHGTARTVLWLAIFTGLLALTLDQLEKPVFLAAYEEGFEVMAEALFIAVLLGLPARQDREAS